MLRNFRLGVTTGSAHHLWRVSFEPLKALTRLESIELDSSECLQLSYRQVQELRALSHLTTMKMYWTADLMHRMLRQPHALQWQSLGDLVPLDVQLCALLPSLLPGLTELHCEICSYASEESQLAFFSHLPNLRVLQLWCDDHRLNHRYPVAPKQLLPALKLKGCCNRLTHLSLIYCPFSSDHMSELLAGCTQLIHLSISEAPQLESLRFLSAHESVTRTLTHLELHDCQHPRLHTTELQHVHALKELRLLQIIESFVEPLDPLELLSQPHSPLLPKLTFFEYTNELDG